MAGVQSYPEADRFARCANCPSSSRDVNVQEFLQGPVFEPLLTDPELFRRVEVDHELGTIVWPTGADMDPVVLHGSAQPNPKTRNGSQRGEPIRRDPGRPETLGGTRDT